MSLRPVAIMLLLLTSLGSGATDVAPYVDPILDFPSVLFEKDQSSSTVLLNASQVSQLRETADILRHNPTIHVHLVGYADSTEGPENECQASPNIVRDWCTSG
jgi:outer membrane protein OmpA-like peptidoglycan-associated protein